MTASSSEAADIVRFSRHLGCTHPTKKVVDTWFEARLRRRQIEIHSMIDLRGHTNELPPA
jgi:hypothetical protein